jgi:hypothetical protein
MLDRIVRYNCFTHADLHNYYKDPNTLTECYTQQLQDIHIDANIQDVLISLDFYDSIQRFDVYFPGDLAPSVADMRILFGDCDYGLVVCAQLPHWYSLELTHGVNVSRMDSVALYISMAAPLPSGMSVRIYANGVALHSTPVSTSNRPF